MLRPGTGPGHTLVEALVVLAVVGVVAALALPALATSLRAARRAEAVTVLLRVHQAQERWRAQCPCFAASLVAPAHPNRAGGCPDEPCDPAQGLGLALPAGRYRYELAVRPHRDAPDTFTAQAVALGDQARDAAGAVSCATLQLVVMPGSVRYRPAECFRR